jgi:hypothetical protein
MQIGEHGDGRMFVGGAAGKEPIETAAKTTTAPPAAAEGPSPFARILRGLAREVDHGEAVVQRTLNGKGANGQELGTGELLALQAGVYRYSEAVDLASRLVDRAASGVKTILQGQG